MTTVQANGVDAPNHIIRFNPNDRRHFIGGSDARVILGDDQDKLARLWQEKRGELAPEVLDRAWYQRSTGQTISDIQKRARHPVHEWMSAALDGMVEQTGAVFEAKFMLPWAFTEEAAAEKHMAQLQHNMWVVDASRPYSRSSPAVANGLRSKSTLTRSISICSLPLRRSFGAAFRAARRLCSSTSKRHYQGWRRLSWSNAWGEFVATYFRTKDAKEEHELSRLSV